MNAILQYVRDYTGFSDGLLIPMLIVVALIVLASIVSVFVSIYLWVKYVRFNKKENSIGMTGKDIARKILDDNELQHIKVKCSGSFLFGNSYSHYFKKVRLRRRTWKKKSVTSLAMAAQKSALAILDKEKDPDMVTRVRLTPLIYLGPIAWIPLILVGFVLDAILFKDSFNGLLTMIALLAGLVFYAVSFVLSIMVLKTEIKGQKKAVEILESSGMATPEEIDDLNELYRLYNIEYVNDMIIALLELILRILQILGTANGSNSFGNSFNNSSN